MKKQKAHVRAATFVAGFLAVLTAGFVTPDFARAQYNESSYFETWTDFATVYNFGDRLRYDGDYGLRAALSTSDFTKLYLRPSARYEALPWLRLHGGIGWFHTFFPEDDDANELRPWVGVRFAGPRPGGWLVQNYFRLEFRAFGFGSGGDSDSDTAWRGRWQLQVRSPDFRLGRAEGFYGLGFVEAFHTFDEDVEGLAAERLRLNLGAGKKLSPHWRVELNGMYQKGRVEEGITGFDLDEGILRLRLFYNFN